MNDNTNNDVFLIETLTDAGLTEEAATKAVAALKEEGFIDYRVVSEGIRD